jgi:hypothetical protein
MSYINVLMLCGQLMAESARGKQAALPTASGFLYNENAS